MAKKRRSRRVEATPVVLWIDGVQCSPSHPDRDDAVVLELGKLLN